MRPPAVFDVTLYVEFRPAARAVQTTYGQAQNRMFDVTMECRIAGMSHHIRSMNGFNFGHEGVQLESVIKIRIVI